ncbi:general substrate transporter [Aaosphaeria arxii CBS 175.79]|uniref:General substrate transporter n=1 Tax=Aaosphaeria arxii CBS 175.79 TaxID=1450172 RepID=A0A6A5X9T6_9PLEO|nr:general substrate transporter [Aaosphaeria arxii CBS 175.79]KAF2009722.1 general substrate transporter [Aaosphaeria arxii CBS 175.79]
MGGATALGDTSVTPGHFKVAGKEFPHIKWTSLKNLRNTYLLLFFVVLTSATNGYDGSMVNGLLSLKQFKDYMRDPSASIKGLFSGIMFLGSLLALPITPYIADGLGRRWGICIGSIIMIFAVILQSASMNFQMFIAARFFLGFGVAIAHGSAPLLITEICHPQHRAIFTTVYNTTWYIGSIIAAWLTFGTNNIASQWSWRIPSILQALPSLLQISCVWFVPESPRWYISKGQSEKALSVLAHVHAEGNVDDEVVQLEYEEIKETIAIEKEAEQTGWLELFKTKGNRHRLLILVSAGLFSQWSGNGLVSYYITGVLDGIGITDPNTQLVINGVLNIWNCIIATTMCFFVDKIGRRPLFLIATGGMMFVFIIWTICSERYDATKVKANGNAVVAMIFLYYTFYNTAWSGLLVGYTVEILPFSLRAKGMCYMFAMVDVALFFNTYVNPIALKSIGWKYYIVYCAWLGFELVFVWFFYIETKNTPLEEIARHFDGDAALLGGHAATEKGRIMKSEILEKDPAHVGEEERHSL